MNDMPSFKGADTLSVEFPERSEHDKELLCLLAGGDREIAAGKSYDLEAVLAEAGALLVEEPIP